MRVVFVEVDTERSWAVASIGPGFLAAYLREHGHEVAFIRATVELSDAEVVAKVVAAGPQLLAFSLTTRQWLRGAHPAPGVAAAPPLTRSRPGDRRDRTRRAAPRAAACPCARGTCGGAAP